MDYTKLENEIRQKAIGLLEGGGVSAVIGLKENAEAGHPTPVFIRDAKDAEKLVWNENCLTNLAVYLLEYRDGPVAVVSKPCDSRAIVNLIAENQIRRENVAEIKVECEGMLKNGELAPACSECLGKAERERDLSFDRFEDEINKCILCFTCRQACPNCYCERCFTDRKASPWRQADADFGEKAAFHLTRAMHLAGRCTDCGACERVCPSGVELNYLSRALSAYIDEAYGFKAGEDETAKSAMNSYSMDDPERGFLGGEGF